MRSVIRRIKPKFLDPAFEDSSVLTSAQMWGGVNSAREQVVLSPEAGSLDPLLNRFTGRGCDLKLHRSLRFALDDRRAGGHVVAMADVSDFETDEITAAQFAVDPQVEECKLANPTIDLEAGAKRPDVLHLERRLLADDLALVPRLAMRCVDVGIHDGLPSS